MSIRNRILIPVVAAIVVAYFAIDAAFRNEARQFQVESAQTRIVAMEECQRQVAGQCLAIASLFSRMPAVQQAFAMAHEGSIHVEKDERAAKARALLRTELEPFAKGYASVMGGRDLRLHFHLPTGRSLLRLWKADQNVSDDISDFRQTVRDVNSGKHEPITGVEVGRGGFAIRGIAAVTGPDGRHLGSVEVLSDYLPVVETAKENDREQVAVYMNARLLPITTKLADRNKYPLLGDSYVRVMSTDAELTDELLTPELLGRAKEGTVREQYGKYQVTAFPVTDYRGEQIGTIALVDDLTPWLARLARIRWGVAIGAAFLLAGLALAVYRTSVSVSKPLKKLAQGLQQIAQGKCDLTRRFDASGTGEVAEAARGINAVLERLQTILHELATGASHMSDSTVKLSTTATQMACETDHMKGQSNSVAVAAEELTANMRSVAEATEEMSTNARTLATAVEEMTASIADVATNAEQAAEVAEGAAGLAHGSNASIRELGSAAEEIGKVIEVIQDIAEQTNLLALNATIEAARAGEAGKGFAVVATEVKELAKQTGAATEDIRKRIEGIQGRTSEAVAAIGKISEAIGNVSNVSRTIASAVEEQSITTRQIAASVAQSSSAVETVARSVSESATVSQDISRTIAAVDSAVNQTARGAGISQDASSNLMGYTDRLQAMVGQFKTDEVRFHAGPIKAAHGKWHYRLSEMLAGRQQLQSTDVADHTLCAFGKWYYGAGQEEFGNVSAYQKIEADHLAVHKLAAEIVELYNGGQKTAAAERLGDFRPLVERLFGLLDELEEHAKAELAVPVA